MSILKTNTTYGLILMSCSFVLYVNDIQAKCAYPRDFSGKDKIVGGVPAFIGYWPGQVVIRYKDRVNKADNYFCGGTLISPDTVLTAAHCLKNFEIDNENISIKGAPVEVVIDTQDLKKVGQDNIRRVRAALPHEGYSSDKHDDDIALLRLSEPWNKSASRLSLRDTSDPKPDWLKPLYSAGFGVLENQGSLVSYKDQTNQVFFAGDHILREAALPLVNEEACKKAYGNNIKSSQLCAGYVKGGKDTCQGDSGGPLVAFDRDSCPYQVGIVSWGYGCAEENAYGVYTRVSAYANWIKQHVQDVKEISESEVANNERSANKLVEPVYKQLKDLLGATVGRATVTVKGGPTIAAGKDTVFEISSDVSGRLLMIDINAKGEVVQLFPYIETNRRHIEAGQRLMIPDNTNWSLPAGEPYGKGKIVVIIAPEKFNNEPGGTGEKGFIPTTVLQAQASSLGYFQNLINQIRLTLGLDDKGFVPTPTETAISGWALASTDYEITDPNQSGNSYPSYDDALTPGILLEPKEKIALPSGVKPRKVNKKGLAMTKESEGFRSRLYLDAAKYCTIAYGHLIKKAKCDGSEPAEFLDGVTEPVGAKILSKDMERAEKAVQVFANKGLSDGQFAALVDFTFNVGVGNLKASTLLKKVNARQFEKVPYEFRRWTKAGDKTWPGLVTRREREIGLFIEGTKIAIPKEAPLPSDEIDIRSGEVALR
jgi:lysozyme